MEHMDDPAWLIGFPPANMRSPRARLGVLKTSRLVDGIRKFARDTEEPPQVAKSMRSQGEPIAEPELAEAATDLQQDELNQSRAQAVVSAFTAVSAAAARASASARSSTREQQGQSARRRVGSISARDRLRDRQHHDMAVTNLIMPL